MILEGRIKSNRNTIDNENQYQLEQYFINFDSWKKVSEVKMSRYIDIPVIS